MIVYNSSISSNVIWDDTKVSVENISELKSFQRYNHFVAMSEISRKDALARNMLKMYKEKMILFKLKVFQITIF